MAKWFVLRSKITWLTRLVEARENSNASLSPQGDRQSASNPCQRPSPEPEPDKFFSLIGYWEISSNNRKSPGVVFGVAQVKGNPFQGDVDRSIPLLCTPRFIICDPCRRGCRVAWVGGAWPPGRACPLRTYYVRSTSRRQCHPGSAAGERESLAEKEAGHATHRPRKLHCICRRRQFDFTQTSPPQLWLFTRQKTAHRLNKLRVASHCCFPGHDFTFSLPTDIQHAVSFAFDLASRRAFTPSGRSSKSASTSTAQALRLGRRTRYEQTNPYHPVCGTSSKFLS